MKRSLAQRIELFQNSDLYPVVSSEFCNGRDVCDIVAAIASAGAGLVQIREKNLSDCAMFELVQQLDFDYIMNSQSLWGCFETVPALRISEMHRPANSQVVTIIHYTWNGRERVLDD